MISHSCPDYLNMMEVKLEFGLFQLVLTEIYYDGFHRTFFDSDPLSEVHETDSIYAIETPKPLVEDDKGADPDAQYIASKYLLLLILNKQGSGSQGKRFAFQNIQFFSVKLY